MLRAVIVPRDEKPKNRPVTKARLFGDMERIFDRLSRRGKK
jgi:hypothetical protein